MNDIVFGWWDLIVILLTFAFLGTLSGLVLSLKTTGETPATEITGAEQTREIVGMVRTISRDLRRQASTDTADLLDAILRTNSFDDRELATVLGWTRKKLRDVRTVLGSYIKHRAKSIPALRRLTRIVGEAAEQLCQKYAVLDLLLEGNFLPTRRSKSLAAIYEKIPGRVANHARYSFSMPELLSYDSELLRVDKITRKRHPHIWHLIWVTVGHFKSAGSSASTR